MKKTYIIAEAGVNHNGSVTCALEMIDAAANAGVDAIKFQTYKTENLVTKNAKKATYQIDHQNSDESQFDMLKKYELTESDFCKLNQHCQTRKVDFLSTPFDLESADFLINVCQVKSIKISSGDLTNAPLLLKVANQGCHVILSTGMATMREIKMALGALAFGYSCIDEKPSVAAFLAAYQDEQNKRILNQKVTILQCTTAYPTDYKDVNLKGMDFIADTFGCAAGLSDHTQGYHIALAAAARGASIIEKHFTLDKNMPGPDHKASIEPYELFHMVKQIREISQALGSGLKSPSECESVNINASRKSLVANHFIGEGEILTVNNLAVKRPGTGISPMYYWDYIGKEAGHNYQQGEVLK